MINILANDGISNAGINVLEKKGFNIVTEKVAQEDIIDTINKKNYEVLLVRSATTVRKELIDACPLPPTTPPIIDTTEAPIAAPTILRKECPRCDTSSRFDMWSWMWDLRNRRL